MSFAGKVVLVTGASSGIGAATALHLAKLGASLAISGRNRANLEDVAEKCLAGSQTTQASGSEINSESGKAPSAGSEATAGSQRPLVVVGNVAVEDDVQKLLTATIERFGKLDVLVNSAGVLESGSAENTDLAQYDRVFGVNVRSLYQLSTLAVPYLIKTKGNIVNVSSVNGIRSFPGVLAYCMSKAAVDQFTRCAALDLAPRGVRVNSVNPGVIVTDIHKRAGMNDEEYQKFLLRCKETHALGRPGNVEEVAKTIAFLAGEDASFITGASVPVDGGRHAMCPR